MSIAVNGLDAKSYYVQHRKNVSSITKKDVDNLIADTLCKFAVPNRTILHHFPVEFVVDDTNIVHDPVGMQATTLTCQLHLLTVNAAHLSNIISCFSDCHVKVDRVMLSIYAAGLACLNEDEKSLGSMIIDFGARTTSFGVFLGGQMIYAGQVPIGGWHITSDIAKLLSVEIKTAEKLKILYGSAVHSVLERENIINLSQLEPNIAENDMVITTADLCQIIIPRIEEIMDYIKRDYDRIAIDHLMSRRIVLTGGSAQMRGMKELVFRYFTKQVRVAQPTLPGMSEEANMNVYSPAIGLTKHEFLRRQRESNLYSSPASFIDKVWNWLRY